MDVIDRCYVLISSGSLRFKSVSKKKTCLSSDQDLVYRNESIISFHS